MTNHFAQLRRGVVQRLQQVLQALILAIVISLLIAAFELDADGKVIARRASPPARHSGVPGAQMRGDVLHDLTVTTDQKMGTDTQTDERTQLRMRLQLRPAPHEQRIDPRPPKLPRRQTDAMQDDELGDTAGGALIMMR